MRPTRSSSTVAPAAFSAWTGRPAQSELNGAKVKIVGSFALGPDFQSDGTVIMSDRTFAGLLHGAAGNPPGIEAGVIKLAPGADPVAVQAALEQALPRDDRGHDQA